MDKFHKALIAVVVLLILWIFFNQPKRTTSGYSDVQAKSPDAQCPPGYNTLGPVTCVKP